MHRLRESRMWKYVAIYLAATMAVPYAVLSFPAVAEAQAQPVMESLTVAVMAVQDTEDVFESVESQKITDALALALDASRHYIVTSRADLRREMQHLELVQPLSVSQQVRLGDRLASDRVLTGELTELEVDERTGAANASLSVRELDVATGEFFNGADVSVSTRGIPGWQGDVSRVTNEVLRELAETTVDQLVTNWIPGGHVTSVNDVGVATTNLGQDHGVHEGMEMLMLRPVWQRTLEEIVMVKVGRYTVSEVGARLSKMEPLEDANARPGDRIHRLYVGPERRQARRARAQHQQTLTVLGGLGALFGLVYLAGGPATTDAPRGVNSFLYQESPGDQAMIRVNIPDQRAVPIDEQVYAWLFYRGDGHRNFTLIPSNLVGVVIEHSLPNDSWDDHPAFEPNIEVDEEFTYLTGDGDEEEVSIEILYHHWPLEPGHTYFHRVRRVVEPMRRAAAGAPIATGAIGTRQEEPIELDDIEFDVDPSEALADGSESTDGVTYFTPPVLETPEEGAVDQRTHEITFVWNATTGANEYVLQVFPEDDPSGMRVPKYQATLRQDAPGAMSHTIRDDFAPNTRFYWRVGARRSGEAEPRNHMLRDTAHGRGWLFSSIRTFTTALAPPPVPSSAGRGSEGSDVQPGTMGIGRYRHRSPEGNGAGQ